MNVYQVKIKPQKNIVCAKYRTIDECIDIKQKPAEKLSVYFSHFVESNFQINRRCIELNMYTRIHRHRREKRCNMFEYNKRMSCSLLIFISPHPFWWFSLSQWFFLYLFAQGAIYFILYTQIHFHHSHIDFMSHIKKSGYKKRQQSEDDENSYFLSCIFMTKNLNHNNITCASTQHVCKTQQNMAMAIKWLLLKP